MTREEKEQAIDTLLVYMNDKIEEVGRTTNSYQFDFNKKNDEYIQLLGSFEKLRETVLIAMSRRYIKQITLVSFLLTEEGQARALSVINAKPNNNESSSKVSIGTLYNSGNMQVGDNNTQNIDNAVNTILNSIDKANAPEEQKEEAKNLLMKFIAHPLTQTLISAASGIGAAFVGK